MNFLLFVVGCFGIWLYFFFERKFKTLLTELKLPETVRKRIDLYARLMAEGGVLFMCLVPTFQALVEYLFNTKG